MPFFTVTRKHRKGKFVVEADSIEIAREKHFGSVEELKDIPQWTRVDELKSRLKEGTEKAAELEMQLQNIKNQQEEITKKIQTLTDAPQTSPKLYLAYFEDDGEQELLIRSDSENCVEWFILERTDASQVEIIAYEIPKTHTNFYTYEEEVKLARETPEEKQLRVEKEQLSKRRNLRRQVTKLDAAIIVCKQAQLEHEEHLAKVQAELATLPAAVRSAEMVGDSDNDSDDY